MIRPVALAASILCISAAAPAQPPAPAPARTGAAEAAGSVTWEGEAEARPWPIFMTLRLPPPGTGATANLELLGQSMPSEIVTRDAGRLVVRAGVEGAASTLVIDGRVEGAVLRGELRQGADRLPLTFRQVPQRAQPTSREEAWAQDLDALSTRFAAFDRSFTPARRALFREELEAIRAQLPGLSDSQIIARMAAAIGMSGNAHTRLYLLRNRSALPRLPIRLWWFSDGLYVVRAPEAQSRLLGCRVDRIGGISTRLSRDLVAPAFAGNPSWIDYMSVYSLTSPALLHGFGVTTHADEVDMDLSGCASAGLQRLRALPLEPSARSVEAWWDLSPAREWQGQSWAHVLAGRAGRLPLYLRNPNQFYWFEHLPRERAIYFKYSRSENMTGENTAAFGERLLAAIDRERPTSLIIDLRFNTGGNLNIASELMRRLQERTRGMRRFIITGRNTFSAGISNAASWKQAGDVTIVGEPVGDHLDMWAEGGNIRLPHSGLDAHFASGAHFYSHRPCPADTPCLEMHVDTLRPDVPVAASWADYRAGRDPAMEAITRLLAGGN